MDAPAFQSGPLERNESLSSRAMQLIRHAIVTGVLMPGETISPQEISARLGVSRTPVREALIHLSAIGLIEFRPGRVQIAPATPEALRDAFALREAIEGKAAALAAQHRTAAEAKAIMAHALRSGRAAKKSDRLAFQEADRDFHLAIGAATHSPQFERYLANVLDLALTLRNLRTADTQFRPTWVSDHAAIAEAIERGDAEEAERASREHVCKVLQVLGA